MKLTLTKLKGVIDSSTTIFGNFTISLSKMERTSSQVTNKKNNKLWYFHTMGYYLATRRNKILIYTTVWMGYKNLILRLRSQTQKITY